MEILADQYNGGRITYLKRRGIGNFADVRLNEAKAQWEVWTGEKRLQDGKAVRISIHTTIEKAYIAAVSWGLPDAEEITLDIGRHGHGNRKDMTGIKGNPIAVWFANLLN